MSKSNPTPPLVASPAFEDDVNIIRAELKVMEGLCACQSDDQHVLAAQEALTRLSARQAAFEALREALEMLKGKFRGNKITVSNLDKQKIVESLALAEAELKEGK